VGHSLQQQLGFTTLFLTNFERLVTIGAEPTPLSYQVGVQDVRWFSLTLLAGFVAAVYFPPSGIEAQDDQPQPKTPAFTETVRPLLKSYCFECHNANKRKAGLNLEKIETNGEALDAFDLWTQVGERLRAKEMPPAKSKQPTDDERQTLLVWVKHVAESRVDYDALPKEQLQKLLAGPTMSRRLSRAEYNNTLRDLFGVDLHAGDLLPSEGGGGEGFDNAGATLFTTPPLMEKYLEAAELVLNTLLPAEPDKAKANSEVEAEQLEAVRRKLLTAVPGPKTTPREAARTMLESFLPRTFRRPTTAKEVERYLAMFDKAAKRGDSYEQSLKLALKGVLVSPSFLFLTETPPDRTGVYQLGHYEVASHLSYFLWGSMPDAELFQLASQGKLHDEKVLREQVQRMVRDPRSRSLADGFAAQWLGIRPLGVTIRPDARLFPEFNDELAAAMCEETMRFFDAIIREDRSVLDIISADYTFVNERLAAHYKMEGIQGQEMRRVKLDDPARGGVLGQASILTVTSFPHRTSPVLRGRWVLEELLGAEVPPPPPDVPVLNERKKENKELTLRQMLEQHRSKPECASCHSRMDPLGFGLEKFDALGRWRTEVAGKPIDSVGILPTGEKFDGPVELKKLLLEKRRPEFLRNLCRKMLGYALGREVTRAELCVVKDCAQALEQGEYRASRLLETIVLSYPFSHRYQKD
jgi:mono/diheme cytochrome c family protein